MKKKIAFILSAFFIALTLGACSCGGGGGSKLAKTPSEEYLRMYNLASAGRVIDFLEQPTFSVSQKGTFEGGNLSQSIGMEALYTHDYSKEQNISYSYSKSINSIFKTNDVLSPLYDEKEYGFQYTPSEKGYRYLESYKNWETGAYPTPPNQIYGNGNYDELFSAFSSSPDNLFREGIVLFNPDFLENFQGEKSTGSFYIDADVKGQNIEQFIIWANGFFPLFNLKDNADAEKVWKFFDMSNPDFTYKAHLAIKSGAKALSEVAITLDAYSSERYFSLGEFTFSARSVFKTGGVAVKQMESLKNL